MTKLLFNEDAYLEQCFGTVADHLQQGSIVLDCIVFTRMGGQPRYRGL